MNADRLLDLYERVAGAPDAIGRLRRFVLDLAVRGRLVEQDPTDKPASELLKRIAAEKARRANATRTRRKKAVHPQMAPPPFDLPRTWCWAALGAVFQYDAGAKCDPKALDSSAWLLELRDVEKGTGRLLNRVRTSERESKSTKSRFLLGDVLYGKLRPYLNKVIVADEPGYSTTEIVAIRPYLQMSSEYCALALRRPDFVDYVTRLGQGTKMPRLRTKDAVVAPFPLPPLAEQRRIVAKVDEVFALCDRLEETRAAREDTRDRLTEASLARLTAPDTDAATFRGHARFAIHAPPVLTARADQVKHLRQTILSLAVQGKLVEQDSADEPAAELLELIRSQRPQAPKDKRRLVHALNARGADGGLFALPSGWEWTPLAGVSDVTMGQSPPGDTYNRSGDGVPLINGPVEFTTGPFGRTIVNQFTTAPRKFCEEGDLLLCVRGSTTGRTNVAGFRACIGRGVAAISSSFDDEFIRIFLWKAREDILAMGRGMAFPSVSKKQLENLLVPLPPLAEQHRIVAKVDELMALCDRLEEARVVREDTCDRLLDSLLHEALLAEERHGGEANEVNRLPGGRHD